jgi:hypothetical protein
VKKLMTLAFALSALFAASGKVCAYEDYPWCIMGDTRGYECVFSSREQCMQDGRNGGFGGQCMQNPFRCRRCPARTSAPAAKHTVTHPAQQTAQPQPKPAGDPLYESCEFPWKHLDVSCPYGR